MNFQSIGLIEAFDSGIAVRSDIGNRRLYSYDFSRPLELTVSGGDKHSVIKDFHRCFNPLTELFKAVDGPIFVDVPDNFLDICLICIDDAAPVDFEGLFNAPLILVKKEPLASTMLTLQAKNRVEICRVDRFANGVVVEGHFAGTEIMNLPSRIPSELIA